MAIKNKKKKETAEQSLIDLTQEPNTAQFISELRLLSSAANGIIMVRAKELQRACESVFEYAVTRQAPDTQFFVWTVTQGWRKLNTNPTNRPAASLHSSLSVDALIKDMDAHESSDPEYLYDLYPVDVKGDASDAIKAIGIAAERMNDKDLNPEAQIINVMFAPEFWFEAPGFQEQVRMFTTKSMDMDCRLILICNDDAVLPQQIQSDIKVIDFMPPNARELFEECESTIENVDIGDGEDGLEMSQFDKERIVQNGLGMTVNEFSSALSKGIVRQDDALRAGEALDIDLIIDTVSEQKAEVIRKSQCLEIIKPVDMSKVGGLDLLKEYFEKRKKAFTKEAREFGVDAPKGIMCCGVPGTGKSLVAKAAAHVFNLPCISFDIGRVFGGLVGQSESQMRVALKQIEAMAPCVVLMDEIDKGFANTSGGGDSGVTARVFGAFLTWMQERKTDAPIYVIMTANNVEHLPPELVRKGRLDEIFCMTFPRPAEREAIFNIHLGTRGHKLSSDALKEAISATNKFVGAEIESVVIDSVLEAFNEGMEAPTTELLVKHANKLKPLFKTFPEKINRMNEWASKNAVPASSDVNFEKEEGGTSERSGRQTIRRRSTKTLRPKSSSLRD